MEQGSQAALAACQAQIVALMEPCFASRHLPAVKDLGAMMRAIYVICNTPGAPALAEVGPRGLGCSTPRHKQ